MKMWTSTISRIPSPTLEQRLLAGLRKDPLTGCWVWVRGKHINGTRGVIRFNTDKVVQVHRIAAFLWLGLDLEDSNSYACHTCDNPLCCCPRTGHLYVGNMSSNQLDAYARGQQPSRIGEGNGRAKLSKKQVTEIRFLYENHNWSQKKIANAYGVTQPRISKIVRRESWTDV